MIPLVLLALGVGVALSAYEFSPHVRARVDDYARVLRDAHEAHRTADAHLTNADMAAAAAASHAQGAAVMPPHPAYQPPYQQPQPPAPPPPATVMPPPALPPPAPAPAPAPSTADAHASAGQVATDAGVDHAVAATAANQEAARKTAEAAQKAKTEAERRAAAASATKVLEREKKIAAAFANLGVGQCGVHSYARVSAQIKDRLLTRLHTEGMDVTGDNPWNIETHQYDVKLRAAWDPNAQVLKLVVMAGQGGYFGMVTCDEIWKKIDPIVKSVIG